jgi:hypothetical protein
MALMEKMLAIYENERYSWDEIFNDPYFTQKDNNIKALAI